MFINLLKIYSNTSSTYNRGVNTIIFVSIISFVQFFMELCMKLGGSNFKYFGYYYIVLVGVLFFLSYKIKKQSILAFIVFILIFLLDKFILIINNGNLPIIGIPLILILLIFMVRGVMALYTMKFHSDSIIEEQKNTRKNYMVSAVYMAASLIIVCILLSKSVDLTFFYLKINSFYAITIVKVILIIISMLILHFYFYKNVVGSLDAAIVNIIILSFITFLSTFVPQHATTPYKEVGYYYEVFGKYLGEFFIFIDLHQIFYSWWFVGQLIWLIFNLIVVTSKRKLKYKNIGFHLTHISLVLLFISIWYNYFFSFKGLVELNVGNMSNKVVLYPESYNKFKQVFIKLPFNILLKSFETKEYKTNYKIYIKKFKGKIPNTLSESTYVNNYSIAPDIFKKSLSKVYYRVLNYSSHPLFSFLSSVGINLLGSQVYSGVLYKYDNTVDDIEKNNITKFLKVISYDTKDVDSRFIEVNKKEKIYFTDISYKIKEYYGNYSLEHVYIPNKIPEEYINDNLGKLNNVEKDLIQLKYYTKLNHDYVLNSKFVSKNDRYNLSHILYKMGISSLIYGNEEAKTPTTIIGLQEANFVGEVALQDIDTGNKKINQFVDENKRIKFIFFWNKLTNSQISNIFKRKDKVAKGVAKHKLDIFLADNSTKPIKTIYLDSRVNYNLGQTGNSFSLKKIFSNFAYSKEKGEYYNISDQYVNPAITLLFKSKQLGKTIEFPLFSLYKQYLTNQTRKVQSITGLKFEYSYISNDDYQTVLINGSNRRLYYNNEHNKIVSYNFKTNTPYSLGGNPNRLLYIKNIFANYDNNNINVIIVPRISIPENISKTDFEDNILSKINKIDNVDKRMQYKDLVNKIYFNNITGYSILPIFKYNKEVKAKIRNVLDDISYKVSPFNPYVKLDIFYKNKKILEDQELVLPPPKGHIRRMPTLLIPNSNYILKLDSKDNIFKEYWKSNLLILDKNKKIIPMNQEYVKVNEYIYYNGYRLYQTNIKEEDPTYSGIGITYEPGLRYIYMCFIMIFIGVVLMLSSSVIGIKV